MSPNNIYIIISLIFIIVIGYDIYNWLRSRKIVTPQVRLQRFQDKISLTVLILGSTLLGASILFHVNVFQYRSPIQHQEVNSITLKDFKGYRLPNQTLDGVKQFAFITTSIDWTLHDSKIEIKSMFHPSRSYVYNANSTDKYLLQHELYHFHITEVFARRIRKYLSTLQPIPTTKKIENIVDINKDLESQMQSRYDDETYHGYILKKQKFWQLKVDSLLSLDSIFSQTTINYQ